MRREPFPLLSELPPELENVILDFHWDVELLHSLDLPTTDLQVAELGWQLRLPFWSWGGRPFQVGPLEVAGDPEVHAEQYARTMAADLRYRWTSYGDRTVGSPSSTGCTACSRRTSTGCSQSERGPSTGRTSTRSPFAVDGAE